jgi:pilus assembly protein Flp/PilA
MPPYRTRVNRARDICLKVYVKADALKTALVRDEYGQDIVEYALLVALLALAATASMSPVASAISTALKKVGSRLSTYTS